MAKQTITKTWLAGLLIILAGAVVSGAITAQVVDITASHYAYLPDNSFWAAMTFDGVCGLAAAGGIVVQLAAWIAAVLNSQRLADKTWFNALL